MVKWLRGVWVNSLRQSWPAYLIVFSMFTLGLAAGAFGVQKLHVDQARELSSYLDKFMQQAGMLEIDTAVALKEAVLNNVMVVLVIYLSGLTVLGIPVMLTIIFMRGFVLGFALDFLAREKSLQGIILACASIVPQNAFLVPALLLGGVASLSFAILLARRFYNSKVHVWPSFVVYSGLMLVIMACSAGAGLIEVYITPLLIKLTVSYIL